jgi:hypothetical protein
MIVAIVALIVALGGNALAGGVLNGKKVNTIITKRAPGLSVAKAQSAKDADELGGLGPTEYRTASNYTQDTTDKTISGSYETIGSPIQITTHGSRRVIAMAAVHAVNAVSGNGSFFICRIEIDGITGVENTDFAAGNLGVVDAAVSPLASAVVEAGTHTVTLLCAALGDAVVHDDALTAWAVSP